ncbi:MAG: nucleotidyltransferase domain-containing protein [Chloroflexi bacterium]|nr:nucleotidyltransferase domain-containing protein [Chloroflexota bacterium]MBU1662088.1 nucleotidyltransferase domain-containing protein [Chloroflexota bacterium]
MLATTQQPYSSSVIIKSVDREAIARAVWEYATELRRRYTEIERIIWFGSWITGLPSPGSDVDICLVVTDSSKPRHIRSVDYLPFGFPVGMDVHVYTRAEFERLTETSPHWFCAISTGREVGGESNSVEA